MAESAGESSKPKHTWKTTRRAIVLAGHGAGTCRCFFRAGISMYIEATAWCLNIVTGPKGRGEAVLIRALEPIAGLPKMRERRPGVPDARLCSGPGNVTKALGVTGASTGEPLGETVVLRAGEPPAGVYSGPRIGLTRAVEKPWRFCVIGSPSMSRGVPRKEKFA